MIKNNKDFAQGKIYKICVHTEDEYKPYIGSTTKKYLSSRLVDHRRTYKQWKNNKTNKTASFDLFDRFTPEKCYIELIEIYPCNSIEELKARERYWFDNIENCNKQRPKLTDEELQNYHSVYGKKDYLEKKDQYKARRANRLLIDPDYLKKQYQRLKELKPEKIQKHREYNAQRVCCIKCNKELRRDSLYKHMKICKESN